MIYSYKRYINGFSAVLEEEEAVEIASMNDHTHSLVVLIYILA